MTITVTRLPGLADNRWRYNGAAHIQDNVSGRYAVWWDANRHPIIFDGTDTFDLSTVPGNPLESPVDPDAHNALNMAVDQDGRVHVAGNMHVHPMRYVRQTADDLTGWTATAPPGDGATNITYPKFVMFAGLLRIFYRTGGSSSGKRWMQTWDGETWDAPLEILDGLGEGESPYLHHIAVRGGWLHLAFMWRQTTSANTNVDLCHMRTRDGVSWQTMAGDTLTLPVTHATSPVIYETSQGDGLLNTNGLDVDDGGNPHVATHIYNDAKTASRILHSWWDGGAWRHEKLFDDWTHKLPLTSPDDGAISRPAVKCHGSRVLLVWKNRVDAPGSLWLSDITPGTSMKTGSILDVDLYAYEPTYDTNGAFRLLVTAARMGDTTHPDYGAVDFARQPLAILEVDLGRVDAVLDGTATVPDTLETTEAEAGPGESVATIRRKVTWLACDTISGGIIDELPSPQGGQISRVIGHATSTGLQFPTPELHPARWNQVTEPLRTMVVCVINDVPAWGGILLNPTDGSGELEGFALATPEAYLGHRYVGDLTFSSVDLSNIAAGLVDVAQFEGIGFTVVTTPTGETGDRTYAAVDGATVLERLSELMDVTDGPEFTCDLEWANADKTAVAKVLRIAPRLGATSGPVFETKGEGNATYQRSRDWSDGRGANHVVATTMGEGDDRPTSDPARDETSIAVRGRWEHRFTPSTSIKHKGTLNRHAQAELARRKAGTTLWSLESKWNAYPRYGVDWRLGDSSTWEVHADRHPDGIEGAGRIIGWKLNLETMRVTPQFEEH